MFTQSIKNKRMLKKNRVETVHLTFIWSRGLPQIHFQLVDNLWKSEKSLLECSSQTDRAEDKRNKKNKMIDPLTTCTVGQLSLK
jgi:hypothetical protein